MAQATDYSIANQSGANFRAELNTILAAVVDSLQDLAIPMERERLVEELCTRLTRDRSAATQELVIEFSRRLGIQIPEVLS